MELLVTGIAYLEGKLRETNIAGMQQVFYQLIESETRTVMLANAQTEYIFKTVDPAVVPQEKSEPKRALIATVATMLGVFTVFVLAFIRSSKDDTTQEKSNSRCARKNGLQGDLPPLRSDPTHKPTDKVISGPYQFLNIHHNQCLRFSSFQRQIEVFQAFLDISG